MKLCRNICNVSDKAFRVACCLGVVTNIRPKLFVLRCVGRLHVHVLAHQTHFHVKGFARGLQWKWLIYCYSSFRASMRIESRTKTEANNIGRALNNNPSLHLLAGQHFEFHVSAVDFGCTGQHRKPYPPGTPDGRVPLGPRPVQDGDHSCGYGL